MRLPCIEMVEVNYVSGSATVSYDEKVIGLKEIKHGVHECG